MFAVDRLSEVKEMKAALNTIMSAVKAMYDNDYFCWVLRSGVVVGHIYSLAKVFTCSPDALG